jgi:hypothetical protein
MQGRMACADALHTTLRLQPHDVVVGMVSPARTFLVVHSLRPRVRYNTRWMMR